MYERGGLAKNNPPRHFVTPSGFGPALPPRLRKGPLLPQPKAIFPPYERAPPTPSRGSALAPSRRRGGGAQGVGLVDLAHGAGMHRGRRRQESVTPARCRGAVRAQPHDACSARPPRTWLAQATPTDGVGKPATGLLGLTLIRNSSPPSRLRPCHRWIGEADEPKEARACPGFPAAITGGRGEARGRAEYREPQSNSKSPHSTSRRVSPPGSRVARWCCRRGPRIAHLQPAVRLAGGTPLRDPGRGRGAGAHPMSRKRARRRAVRGRARTSSGPGSRSGRGVGCSGCALHSPLRGPPAAEYPAHAKQRCPEDKL